jgi:hypothetical protein
VDDYSVAYASVIPFSFTTMLVELALALALLAGVVQPDVVLNWLLGPGAWFPATYQLIAVIWIAALFVMAAASIVGLLHQTVIYPTNEMLVLQVPTDVFNLVVGLPILLGSM